MTAYQLLRSAYRHARNARRLANEANELAVCAMVEAKRSQRLALEVEGKVMEAARPFIELAEFNAALSEGFAQDAKHYERKARACSLSQNINKLFSIS